MLWYIRLYVPSGPSQAHHTYLFFPNHPPQDVRTALEAHGLGSDTPVIVTSAANRLGRDDMWRYLRLVVLK